MQVACGTHCATNYPLPVAVGASFNMTLVHALAHMMGVELRALRLEHSCEKHVPMSGTEPPSSSQGNESYPDACIGLDTWAPNLNLNRDPRWGRNWEVRHHPRVAPTRRTHASHPHVAPRSF